MGTAIGDDRHGGSADVARDDAGDGALQAVSQGDGGLPAQLLLGQLDHGLALEGIAVGLKPKAWCRPGGRPLRRELIGL
ncbi:hypothetical protein [Synechococcus sp. CS-1333]|uniref:hypothetical protein n=1 Tax=Synechococcus sp. CS-1333 TaxID=2848638 RepID=UPI0037DA4D03